MWFRQNIIKGIENGLYREEVDVDTSVNFYYILIFNIHENISSEKEARKLEFSALEYHTRAMATPVGIIELEKQLQKSITQ